MLGDLTEGLATERIATMPDPISPRAGSARLISVRTFIDGEALLKRQQPILTRNSASTRDDAARRTDGEAVAQKRNASKRERPMRHNDQP